jgi:hypothetical protein
VVTAAWLASAAAAAVAVTAGCRAVSQFALGCCFCCCQWLLLLLHVLASWVVALHTRVLHAQEGRGVVGCQAQHTTQALACNQAACAYGTNAAAIGVLAGAHVNMSVWASARMSASQLCHTSLLTCADAEAFTGCGIYIAHASIKVLSSTLWQQQHGMPQV